MTFTVWKKLIALIALLCQLCAAMLPGFRLFGSLGIHHDTAPDDSISAGTDAAMENPTGETAPDSEPNTQPQNTPVAAFHAVYITTADGMGLNLEKSDGYVPATVQIAEAGSITVTDTDAKFKVRGNSTAQGAKKPYNIKFSEKQDLFGMGKAKKWCLLAECYDPTLLRNAISRDFAQELGLAFTAEYTFAEVYIDGVYNGLYLLSEAVETGKSRVAIDTDGGDFLVEYNRDRTEDGVTYVTVEVNGETHRFEVDEPEELTREQLAYITAALQALVQTAAAGDWEALTAIADMDSFAAYYLLNEFLKTTDCPAYSTYFHLVDGIWYAGPVWDYDLCAGNYSPYTHSEYGNNGASWEELWCNRLLFGLLTEYDEFNALVWEKFLAERDYFTKLWAEDGLIDTMIAQYEPQLMRNAARWDPSVRYGEIEYPPKETYGENVEYLRTWLKKRCRWLESYWEKQARAAETGRSPE